MHNCKADYWTNLSKRNQSLTDGTREKHFPFSSYRPPENNFFFLSVVFITLCRNQTPSSICSLLLLHLVPQLFSPHDINAINLTVIPTCFPFNFTSSSASLPCGGGSSFTQSLFSSSSSPSLTPDSADNAHRRGKFGDPFVRHRARHRQFSERLSISGEFSACKQEQRSDFERIHELRNVKLWFFFKTIVSNIMY